MKVFDLATKNGRDFETAVKETLAVVLSSPHFVYVVESGGDKKQTVSDVELANRLAIFLWSGMPDQRLLSLAQAGKLSQPAVLDGEVRRMLLSPKSDVFFETFVTQWLELDRLKNHNFAYPEFDVFAKESARREPIEFFKTIVRENLGLDNLIDSDFVVIDAILARLYGIQGVKGMEFRKVALPRKSVRGGLLAQAGILAHLSDGRRTKPMDRGAFVLRKLLDNPPASPPPNVPLIAVTGNHSTRELIEKHRKQATCAACHRKIDPLGFGLENFNAIGKWRLNEARLKIGKQGRQYADGTVRVDPSGTLGDRKFNSFIELRTILAEQHPQDLVSALSKALIHYGCGRTVSFTDRPHIDKLAADAEASDFKAMEFMIAFIKSELFTKK